MSCWWARSITILGRLNRNSARSKQKKDTVNFSNKIIRAFARVSDSIRSNNIFFSKKRFYKFFSSTGAIPFVRQKKSVILDTEAGSNFLRKGRLTAFLKTQVTCAQTGRRKRFTTPAKTVCVLLKFSSCMSKMDA